MISGSVSVTVLLLLFLLTVVEGLPPEVVLGAGRHHMMTDVYQPMPYNTSQQCRDGINRVLYNDTTKIGSVIDAAGKPASGFSAGNMVWLGSFEMCRNITGMQYCLVDITIDKTPFLKNTSFPLPLRWGLCTVQECSEADIAYSMQDIVNGVLGIPWLHVWESSVHCAKDPPIPYSTGFYVFISICAILCFLMVFGWFLDELIKINADQQTNIHKTKPMFSYNYDEDNTEDSPLLSGTPDVATIKPTKSIQIPYCNEKNLLVELFLCFALNRNLQRLLTTYQSEKAIRCLHGLRFISMSWVILGHTFLWPSMTLIIDNWTTMLSYLKMFSFQVIVNGTYSVDTFFFLSGLLIGYLVFFELDKTNGQFPWFKFYFHRYWRLTPTLMFVILFWMYLEPWLGQGPVWYSLTNRAACENYWWTNILYINNFYPTNNIQGCIPWSWYLANDMQFHWVSPIFVIAMYKRPKIGLVVLSIGLIATFVTTGALTGYYDFSAIFSQAAMEVTVGKPNFFDTIYSKPYCRIAPYLTGLAMGFFLQRHRDIHIRYPFMFSVIGWLSSTGIAIAVIYGLYHTSHGHVLSTTENIFYASFSRFAWSISIAWVVFTCQYGLAGVVNSILSWDFWIPLSRLTYSAYLFHPIVLDVLVFNFATPFHYTLSIIAFMFVGVAGISYGVAALVYLSVEQPMANIEKVIEDRIKKNRKEK